MVNYSNMLYWNFLHSVDVNVLPEFNLAMDNYACMLCGRCSIQWMTVTFSGKSKFKEEDTVYTAGSCTNLSMQSPRDPQIVYIYIYIYSKKPSFAAPAGSHVGPMQVSRRLIEYNKAGRHR